MPQQENLLITRLTASPSRSRWVEVGNLIDGSGASPFGPAHLVYDDRSILFVGKKTELPPRDILEEHQTEPDVVLPRHTALPGLIEAHSHLFLEGGTIHPDTRKAYLQLTPETLLEQAGRRLAALRGLGLAAIRDAGDNRGVGLALRDASRNAPLPFIDSPGPAIHRRGRYGSFLSIPLEDFDGPEECVDSLCSQGVDRIKIIATGIINFQQGQVTAPPQMTVADLEGFVKAAHLRKRPTFAHASGTDGIARVVAAGVDSVEHGYFVSPRQLATMRDRQLMWVPTLAPVQVQVDRADAIGWSPEVVDHLKRILESHRNSIRMGHEMGVRVVAGSDAGSFGVPHGLGLIREMELMEESGMPALSVIAAATGRSSEFLALREPVGRLASGFRCRFLLTAHDPLESLQSLLKPRIVLFDGVAREAVTPRQEDRL